MLNRSSLIFFTALFIGAGGSLNAQQSVPIVTEGAGNYFYSQYEVIEDHPECSGTHQVAFRMPIVADRLDYRLHDPANDASISSVKGEVIASEQECFVKQRSGGEVHLIHVECPEESEALDDSLADIQLEVQLRGAVTACISPHSTTLLEHEWSVRAESIVGERAYGGQGQERISFIEAATTNPNLTSPSLGFSYFQGFSSRFSFPWEEDLGGQSLLGPFETTPRLEVDAICLPFELDRDEETPLFLEFDVAFAIVDRVPETCSGDGCPVSNDVIMIPPSNSGEWCVQK